MHVEEHQEYVETYLRVMGQMASMNANKEKMIARGMADKFKQLIETYKAHGAGKNVLLHFE
jgi:hypothetical protein